MCSLFVLLLYEAFVVTSSAKMAVFAVPSHAPLLVQMRQTADWELQMATMLHRPKLD